MKFTGNAKTTSPLITGDKRRDEAVIVYILALADISQYEIANRLSVKPQTVNQVVKRKTNSKRVLDYIERLADEFNFNYDIIGM